MIKVGTNHSGYNQNRNYISLPFKNYEVRKTFDYYKLFDFINFKLFSKNHKVFHYFHKDILLPGKPDLYHFFNTVSYSRKPWIVTHEAAIPRFGINKNKGLELLAGNSCKKIISFCKNAQRLLEYSLHDYPQYQKEIQQKNIVIQPGQNLFTENISNKNFEGKIIFTFVGTDFFRKGGYETLKVFDKLLEMGANIHLNIISGLAYNTNWKDNHITASDFKIVTNIINKHPNNISHFQSLPNPEVLKLLKESHIGLLPSYGETYGYSVLESQACGTPVITTNMPPFEEFNNNEIGWLIDVPLIERDGSKTSDVYSENGINEFSTTLEKNLYDAVTEIINSQDIILKKSENSINNIRQNHNPQIIADKIEKIYSEALED